MFIVAVADIVNRARAILRVELPKSLWNQRLKHFADFRTSFSAAGAANSGASAGTAAVGAASQAGPGG